MSEPQSAATTPSQNPVMAAAGRFKDLIGNLLKEVSFPSATLPARCLQTLQASFFNTRTCSVADGRWLFVQGLCT